MYLTFIEINKYLIETSVILRGDEAVVEAAEMLMVVMYVNVCMRGCDAPLQIFRDML